jgi:hypothetical protein
MQVSGHISATEDSLHEQVGPSDSVTARMVGGKNTKMSRKMSELAYIIMYVCVSNAVQE